MLGFTNLRAFTVTYTLSGVKKHLQLEPTFSIGGIEKKLRKPSGQPVRRDLNLELYNAEQEC
jgi:hypothetical protein